MVVSMFCLAIGGEPTGLKLAIVNEELSGDCHSSSYEAANHCDYSMISCRYLLSLTNETITQVKAVFEYFYYNTATVIV